VYGLVSKFLKTSFYCLSSVYLIGFANADSKSENYIKTAALEISNASVSGIYDEVWRLNLNETVNNLVDFDLMARFSIGRHVRSLSQLELDKYTATYRKYALITFEQYFKKYENFSIEIVGSVDLTERDSVVSSRVTLGDGEEIDLKWRVLYRNGVHKIVDIAIELEGSQLWLAIEQRSQFLAIINSPEGAVDDIIAVLQERITELRS